MASTWRLSSRNARDVSLDLRAAVCHFRLWRTHLESPRHCRDPAPPIPRAGDGLLLGADLVKPERQLLDAYDDPLGLTAAFNRNLLVRLQTELGARLDLDGFFHKALWNASAQRVEMHLVSRREQQVVVPASGLDFIMAANETIWTESSYKYEPEEVLRMLETCGFSIGAQWVDDGDRFALTHAIVR